MALVDGVASDNGVLTLEALLSGLEETLTAERLAFLLLHRAILSDKWLLTAAAGKTFGVEELRTELDAFAYGFVANGTLLADFSDVAGVAEQGGFQLVELAIN